MRHPASGLTSRSPRGCGVGGHAIAITLLHQGHRTLAVAVCLPLSAPFVLASVRLALAQAEALVGEVRAWVDRERRRRAQQRAAPD
jgi:hypothetical protein